MSIDKKGFRYRLSNVIAWFGLGQLGAVSSMAVFLIIMAVRSGAIIDQGWDRLGEVFAASLGVYLGCALINYLMMGSLRLLPWKDIE